jgi:hypothetical protein
MSEGHFFSAGGYIEHGDASVLFPLDELRASVHQHSAAASHLQSVDSEDVLAIAPTSLASSYFLFAHPLTTIDIDTLSREIRTRISEQADIKLAEFDVIQIGRGAPEATNERLPEW